MKIIYIIPFYKRHDLTALCFESLQKQGCDVYTVGSEGDQSKQLAHKYGFNYLEHENRPLGAKLNALIKTLKEVEFDYICLLGSDNFISDNFTTLMTEYLTQSKEDFTTFNSLYFYNQNTRVLTFYKGVTGVGRMFSRKLVESCNFSLWEGYKNAALDTSCEKVLNKNGFKATILDPIILGVEVMDVKYSENITTHDISRAGKIIKNNSMDLCIFESLKEYSNRTYKRKKDSIMKVEKLTLRILKSGSGLTEGQIITISKRNAVPLINMGTAEIATDAPKKAVTAKSVAKVEPCEECKEGTKGCKECEEAAQTTNIPTRGRKKAVK